MCQNKPYPQNNFNDININENAEMLLKRPRLWRWVPLIYRLFQEQKMNLSIDKERNILLKIPSVEEWLLKTGNTKQHSDFCCEQVP